MQRLIAYLGKPPPIRSASPPPRAGPPDGDEDFDAREGDTFALSEPLPEHEFDQRASG